MISVYTLEQAQRWNDIVKSFRDYDVYYLSGYVKAFEIHGDGQPLLIYFESEDTRAINVVMKRDVADCEHFKNSIEKNTYFDFVTPYGYGGFLVEGTAVKKLQEEYEAYCVEHNIVSEFVRFHPLLENWKRLEDMYGVVYRGETVCMDTTSEAVIWKNLTSKNRNMIRKAEKNGVEVFRSNDEAMIDVFMEIYKGSMDKVSAEKYYYFERSFYKSICEDLSRNATWFYAKKDDEIVAISVFLFSNGKMHYHLSASRRESQNLAATNLLLYEAAIWAANHGYSWLHLGGGVGASHDSLYTFKKAFNRKENSQFCVGKKVLLPDVYARLIDCRKQSDTDVDDSKSYFPAYRG